MNKFALAATAAAVVLSAAPASAALVVNAGTIGQRVVVQSTNDVIARFESSEAALTSRLYLDGRAGVIFNNKTSLLGSTVNLGSFAVGTELVFRIETAENPTTTTVLDVFRTGPASRNADGIAHAAVNTDNGVTFVGFEDQRGTNPDYNDLVFSFTNVAAASGAVPEPATWGLMLAGFGMVGAGLRSRRRSTTVTYA